MKRCRSFLIQRTLPVYRSGKDWTGAEANPFSPTYVKSYFIGSFILSMMYLCVYAVDIVLKTGDIKLSEEQKKVKERINDPRRPPWPLLHQKVVFMREGQTGHEDINLLWTQAHHYYPDDWLIPLELTQILKYSSGHFLQNYVPDPERMRKEVISQLDRIRRDDVAEVSSKVGGEVCEIIGAAIEDLEQVSLIPTTEPPLIPTHTK